MNYPYLVSQYIGAGDIIFTQTLVKEVTNGGTVVWPTEKYYVDGFSTAYTAFTFLDKSIFDQSLYNVKEIGFQKGFYILPIRWSDQIMKVPYKDVMRSKYDMFGLDWTTWKKDAYPKRKIFKEKELYSKMGLSEGEKYNLINKNYLRNRAGISEINVVNEYRNIYMDYMEGYSLFDWCYLIENAAMIYTVSTSVLFLLELIELKAEEVHLYSRKPYELGFSFVDYLFSKNYILHD